MNYQTIFVLRSDYEQVVSRLGLATELLRSYPKGDGDWEAAVDAFLDLYTLVETPINPGPGALL